jgi:hypothetical protein
VGVENVFPENENSKLFSNLSAKIIKRSRRPSNDYCNGTIKAFSVVSMETTIMHETFFCRYRRCTFVIYDFN